MCPNDYTPTPWACEEGVTPFYNDVNGYSCGGDGTGICEIFRVDEQGNSIWDADGELELIDVFSVENAAFIVEAVNSYEANQALIAKLTEALEACKEMAKVTESFTSSRGDDDWVWGVQKQIDAALSLARESTK